MATREEHRPTSYVEALATIASAKARGGRVLCGMQCGREAELLLVCKDGTFQGVGCQQCWDKHAAMMEMALIWQASGWAQPQCTRCGDQSPGSDHVRTERIE